MPCKKSGPAKKAVSKHQNRPPIGTSRCVPRLCQAQPSTTQPFFSPQPGSFVCEMSLVELCCLAQAPLFSIPEPPAKTFSQEPKEKAVMNRTCMSQQCMAFQNSSLWFVCLL